MPHLFSRPVLAIALLASPLTTTFAQASRNAKTTPVAFDADSARLAELPWRSIGPAVTSGRVVDFAVPEGPASQIGERLGELFYVASASGGVWKTVNGGTTWEPIFDHEGSASIGDIAVAPSNPEIIWVGTGENNNQRSASWGDGVYKSENGGKSWTNMGLRKSEHIGRIIVHPTNPQIVFVAAAGPLWNSGGERGLYRTTDGGRTWKNVKNIDQYTGFTDVIFDPSNPDVIEGHRRGHDQHRPLHAETQQARGLDAHIDGLDQHGSCEEAGDYSPDHQDGQRRDEVRHVLEDRGRKACQQRGIERGEPKQQADQQDGPVRHCRHQPRRTARRRPAGK